MHSISMKFCIDLRIHDTFKKQISLSNVLNTKRKYDTSHGIIHYKSMIQKYVTEENTTVLFKMFVQFFVRRDGKVGLLSSLDCIKG